MLSTDVKSYIGFLCVVYIDIRGGSISGHMLIAFDQLFELAVEMRLCEYQTGE